ncbi:hypothetical protein [Salegentibacter sp. T436]|uniref:hypothetical protein n=1 Tax=Salegentibacter sp. T436 TaxID=1729720 RepID=UPI00094A752A|nr:hypothetical protein [Salegentibacter sp. T436]APS40487.1 hypothetical protein AO058_17105 [Salegentibacter sp. T436]
MKKVIYFLTAMLFSCGTETRSQELLIINYLEDASNGVKTDLKIDILDIEMSDVTIADSLSFIETKFQERIAKEEESIESFKSNIKSAKEENKSLDRSNVDNLAKISANKSVIKLYENGLEKALLSLKKNQDQKAVALGKYENQDENVVLVKKGVTNFSFFNPKLDTRQERTETFVFSKDASKVLGIIYKGRLGRKR